MMGREHWVEAPFSDLLVTLESGSRPRGGVKGISEGTPSIGAEHLTNDGGFDFANLRYVPNSFAINMKRGLIEKDDILIVKDGATTGKTSFVASNFPYKFAYLNEHVFRCCLGNNLLKKYVFYYLRSQNGQNQIMSTFHGGAQGGINSEFVNAINVPLPPLPEQKRIVAKLDAILPRVKSAQARLEKIPRILKKFRQSVLAAACSGRLTEEWRVVNQNFSASSIKNSILNVQSKDNGSYSKFEMSEEIPTWGITNIETIVPTIVDCPHSTPKWTISGEICLRTTNFFPFNLDLSEIRYVSLSTYKERIRRLEPGVGDVLYSREGGILGIACQFPMGIKACLGQRMMLLRCKQNWMSGEYLTMLLNSEMILSQVRNLITGSAAPHLNVGDVKCFEILVPPLAEQHEIVRRVENLFSLADSLESKYKKAISRVEKIEQSVLAKAFRGELVEPDPDDEPAEELLKRILEENAGIEGSKKTIKGKKLHAP